MNGIRKGQTKLWNPVIHPAFIACILCLTVAATALAHGALKTASPKDGEHLNVAPRELRLTFTEAPEIAVAKVTLTGPDGQVVTLAPLRKAPDSNATIIAAIEGGLTGGVYTVNWQIAGEDGHPVKGTYSFVIAPGSPGLADNSDPTQNGPAGGAGKPSEHTDAVAIPTSGAGVFDAESPGYAAVRFFMYAALLTVIGAVAFHLGVLGIMHKGGGDADVIADMSRRAAAVGVVGALLLVASCVARLGAQSVALHGNSGLTDLTLVGTLISGTNWGRSWLLQLIAAGAALGSFKVASRSASRPKNAWGLAVVAAVILAFTPAFASHAAASPKLRTLAILSDGFHVLGAAGWLGSLLLVVTAGIPAAMALSPERRGTSVAQLINAFSPTALVFAGLVFSTGLFAAWLHVGGFAPLWRERYGQLLLAKLAVLSIVALTGAYNWLRVRPSLGEPEGATRVRKSAAIEVGIAVAILIITAILVATPTPMDPM